MTAARCPRSDIEVTEPQLSTSSAFGDFGACFVSLIPTPAKKESTTKALRHSMLHIQLSNWSDRSADIMVPETHLILSFSFMPLPSDDGQPDSGSRISHLARLTGCDFHN